MAEFERSDHGGVGVDAFDVSLQRGGAVEP